MTDDSARDATSDAARVYRVQVDASPEDAWAALTEPEQTRAWYFGSAARTTWEVGSPIEYRDGDGALQITGTVLTFDPPRSFSHSFVAVWSGTADDQGVLEWIVEPDGDRCTITLVHTGGHGEETASGSQYLVGAVKEYLEAR